MRTNKQIVTIKYSYVKNLPLKVSFRAVEFTAVSLLPAVAADVDITVPSLVGH